MRRRRLWKRLRMRAALGVAPPSGSTTLPGLAGAAPRRWGLVAPGGAQ
jgi:hypothetical protein